MTCTSPAPFAPRDPFLPGTDAPVGPCPDCLDVHRLDLGCPVGERARMRVVALLCAIVVAVVAGLVWGYA